MFSLVCLILMMIMDGSNVAVVMGHPFSICPNQIDHLHVKKLDIKPDPPRAGEKLTVSITMNPDIEFKSGNAKIVAKVLGVEVGQIEIDVCAYTNCPINANKETTIHLSGFLPYNIPAHVEATIQVIIIDSSFNEVTCIVSKVVTSLDDEEQVYDFNNDKDETFFSQEKTPLLKGGNNAHVQSSIKKSIAKFMYTQWLQQYHKSADIDWYPIKEDEDSETKAKKQKIFESKFIIFAENLIRILEHNQKYRDGKTSYTMTLNHFAHLKNEEFAAIYLNGYKQNLKNKPIDTKTSMASKFWEIFTNKASSIVRIPQEVFKADIGLDKKDIVPINKNDDLPEEFDWGPKGAVSPVKNQGSCGSCWAFSAIQALEGAYFLKYGDLKLFSEQQLVSCDDTCYGCGGGLMDLAFEWINKNGGICTEDSYPYVSGNTGASGYCQTSNCEIDPKTKIQSWVDVDRTEDGLKSAIAQQPVSVAIEADQYAFQFYSSGVLTADCGDHLDHGVLAVGYGKLDGIPFWKLKNSWGANWGMEGYILIERGKQVPNGDDECGILANPSYPVL